MKIASPVFNATANANDVHLCVKRYGNDNKGEIYKTRLVYGFQFRKITAGLYEPLKPAPLFCLTVAYNCFALFHTSIYKASFSFHNFPPRWE